MTFEVLLTFFGKEMSCLGSILVYVSSFEEIDSVAENYAAEYYPEAISYDYDY